MDIEAIQERLECRLSGGVDPAALVVAPVDGLLILHTRRERHADTALLGELMGGGVELPKLARQVATREPIVVQEAFPSRPKVLELHLVHVEGHHLQVVIPIDDEAVVRLVAEVGRSVDVVHLHPSFLAVEIGPVHLAGMRHEDDQTLVATGEAGEGVVDMGIPLQLALAVLLVLLNAVERVDHEDTHPTASYRPMGDVEDVVEGITLVRGIAGGGGQGLLVEIHQAILAEAGQDVADVGGEPADTTLQQLVGELGRGLEGIAGELLAELAQVVGDRDVLRRKIGHAPIIEQGHTQAQLVDELRLAIPGSATHHHVATRLEGDQFIHTGYPRCRTSLQPLPEQLPQLLFHILGGLYAHQGDVVCRFDAHAHPLLAILHQYVVGILATLRPLHQLATLRVEPTDQLVAQDDTPLVVVECQDDANLILQVGLHETVEEGEVRLCAVRHGDGLQVATLDEGERIKLPLGDVADRLVDQCVDVPGNQLTFWVEGESLVEGAVFHVDVVAPVEERKGDGAHRRVAPLALLIRRVLRRKRGVGQHDAVTL